MKAYTDLPQSKKLAEILPLESADMYWKNGVSDKYIQCFTPFVCGDSQNGIDFDYDIPCWSLAALIDVLPTDYIEHKHYFLEISKMGDNAKPYEVRYFRFREDWEGANFGRITRISCTSNNLIDACYKMILKLHEIKML